jgi:type III pantothenate kinase
VISGSLDVGLKLLYDHPKLLGADRICNAVAGFSLYGGPTIIIDLGTATTFDVVSGKGEYLGGVIAPGIETAAEALHKQTAQLPRILLKFPENIIGKNTLRGMQAGIMFGALDAMEGIVHRIKKITGNSTIVILTGGLAEMISQRTSLPHTIEPSLVLRGALMIYECHTKN